MKKEQNFTFSQRVEKLRVALDCGWEEVAKRLGISRTRLHQLRNGDATPSEKVLHRLAEAEMEAGIRKRPVERGRGVLQYLMSKPADTERRITFPHIHSDTCSVKVAYRGRVPRYGKNEIELRAPKDVTVAANLMIRVLLEEDVETLVLECLPPELASVDFLNLLEPASFLDLVEAAAVLTFGNHWRRRFAEQLKRAAQQPKVEN